MTTAIALATRGTGGATLFSSYADPLAGFWISAETTPTTARVSFLIHLPALGVAGASAIVRVTHDDASDKIVHVSYGYLDVRPWVRGDEEPVNVIVRILAEACARALEDPACEGALGNAIARARALLPGTFIDIA